jgi:hypothetical protein
MIAKSREGAVPFAGVNYLAIVIAAVAAWLIGAAWYMVLGKVWMAALGKTPEEIAACRSQPPPIMQLVLAFVAALVMAWVLAGLVGHFGAGQVTVMNGIISGAFCWLGFVATTMLVNNSFAQRDGRLLLIDSGHWLVVLLVVGAIIGAMGV